MQRIAIVGGGIAGLTVALRRSLAGDEVTLFESSHRVGGQLVSETRHGFLIEQGAEGFIARSEAVPALARDVGLADQLIEQLVQQSFAFDRGSLRALAPGEAGRLLGFQVSNDELGRGIRSFRNGMGALPQAIAGRLRDHVEFALATRVAWVDLGAPGIVLGLPGGDTRSFDALVIATSARSAAALLAGALGESARALAQASLTSSVTVSLAYRSEQIRHSLDGTGLIVPQPEDLAGLRAVTFVSSKLPHRAPSGQVLLRCFFRPDATELNTLDDALWSERAERGIGLALPISGAAEHAWTSRWQDALPVFDDPHRARVTALEAELANSPIFLTGAAFHGSGIDAAVRSGERTALALTRD